MITKQNIETVFDLISENQIKSVMESLEPYICLTISSYGVVKLESCEEIDQNILDNGGVICDVDDFFRLFKESGSLNPFLIEYL